MRDLWDGRYTPDDAKLIKHKAKKLTGHYGYRAVDLEDIEQELALHLWTQMAGYDSRRGARGAYALRIVKNKLLHMIEHRTAVKRNRQHDVPIESVGEGATADCSSSPDRLDLQIDLQQAISRMPSDLRRVAVALMKSNPTDAARALGLTRGQMRQRQVAIGRYLATAGIETKSVE